MRRIGRVPGGGQVSFGEPGKLLTQAIQSDVIQRQADHEVDERGDGCGIGATAQRDDEPPGPALAQVVEEPERLGPREFLLLQLRRRLPIRVPRRGSQRVRRPASRGSGRQRRPVK